jgi:threonine dehydratase
MDQLSLADIRATAERLKPYIVRTPVLPWSGLGLQRILDGAFEPVLKLELFQHSGTFKARGAINVLLQAGETGRAAGVTAVSAGNHAIATAYAARLFGVSAKVVMIQTANPARVARARSFGAEVVMAGDPADAFQMVERLQKEEGRLYVHPFEGPHTSQATGTIGLEFLEQVPDLDAVIVPVGGGGLVSGIAAAIKQARPDCAVYGVEPEGADNMRQSLAAGVPVRMDRVQTIADSLAPPYSLPFSFDACRRYLDEVVTVPDQALQSAMGLLFDELKLALEPAGAASTAAALGPLRQRLAGKRVGLIVCGSNIDLPNYTRLAAF